MDAPLRELYGTRSCPYTRELREDLDWRAVDFVEYDVERDPEALRRVAALCAGPVSVPILVEDGRIVQVGFGGRSCFVTPA